MNNTSDEESEGEGLDGNMEGLWMDGSLYDETNFCGQYQNMINEDVGKEEPAASSTFENSAKKEEERGLLGWYEQVQQQIETLRIRQFSKLHLALHYHKEVVKGKNKVYAIPKPIHILGKQEVKTAEKKVKIVREYLVCSPFAAFRLLHATEERACLDEVILSDEPIPLYFDIEISQVGDVDQLDMIRLAEVLKANMEFAIGDKDHPKLSGFIETILVSYKEHAGMEWDEDLCTAGIISVVTSVSKSITSVSEKTKLPGKDDDFTVLTACRSEKFSVHLVCNRVYADSQVRSMPLLAYEIARDGSIENMKYLWKEYLMGGTKYLESDEAIFSIRALMIEKMAAVGESGEEVVFRGKDDSLIDEAIYSKNHLLRLPGACKLVGKKRPPLVPYFTAQVKAIPDMMRFSQIYPISQEGFDSWMNGTICSRGIDSGIEEALLFANWKPTVSYPNKRGWYRDVSLQEDMSDLTCEDLCSEVKLDSTFRFIEGRQVGRSLRGLTEQEKRKAVTNGFSSEDKKLSSSYKELDAKQVFKGEDHVFKPFYMFKVGDSIFCKHGGNTLERTPSGCVFAGGYTCFGCNPTTVFKVVHSLSEEEYRHEKGNVFYAKEEDIYISDVVEPDWEKIFETFRVMIMDSPQGTGKTFQISRATAVAARLRLSTIYIVNRIGLARQIALRLGIRCYLDMSHEELKENKAVDMVIVINSLWKLGDLRVYDFIVFDEVAQIRRHLLNRIMESALEKVYSRLVQVVQQSRMILLAQEGVSLDDAYFFSSMLMIDPVDRRLVTSLKMVKQVKMHDLQYSSDRYVVVEEMLNKFQSSVRDVGGESQFLVCDHPFMVFSSSKRYAQYLVFVLKRKAIELGSNPDRVRGLWSGLPEEDEWAASFVRDPNEHAKEVDVLVVTSIMGTGTSIDCHFEYFVAFLGRNSLLTEEEWQLIRRLRFNIKFPKSAVRESLLFIQEGKGTILEYDVIRRALNELGKMVAARHPKLLPHYRNLEETQARILQERSVTDSNHFQQFMGKLKTHVSSKYEEMEKQSLQKRVNDYWLEDHKQWKIDTTLLVASSVRISINKELRDGGVTEGLDEETQDIMMMDVVIAADARKIEGTLSGNFEYSLGVINLLDKREKNPVKVLELLGNEGKIINLVTVANNFVRWSLYYMDPISKFEFRPNLIEDILQKRYSLQMLKRFCNWGIGFHLLPRLLSPVGNEIRGDYLVNTATLPYFNGLKMVKHQSFCDAIARLLQTQAGDDIATTERKETLQFLASSILKDHGKDPIKLEGVYKDVNNAFVFLRIVLKGLGLELKGLTKEENGRGTRIWLKGEQLGVHSISKTHYDVVLALLVKSNDKCKLIMDFENVLGHVSEDDKKLLNSGMVLYKEIMKDQTRMELGTDSGMGVTALVNHYRRVQEDERDRASSTEEPQVVVQTTMGVEGTDGQQELQVEEFAAATEETRKASRCSRTGDNDE